MRNPAGGGIWRRFTCGFYLWPLLDVCMPALGTARWGSAGTVLQLRREGAATHGILSIAPSATGDEEEREA